MNKLILLTVPAVILAVIIGVVIANSSNSVSRTITKTDILTTTTPNDTEASQVKQGDDVLLNDEFMQGESEAVEKMAGEYRTYDASLLGTGINVIFFHASWCPTCRSADENIRTSEASIPQDMQILKVDYDTSIDLRKKYGVTYQHTFVQVDASGELIKKWSGSSSLSEITNQIL